MFNFEFRNLKSIFGDNTAAASVNFQKAELLNSYTNYITQYNDVMYDDLTVRSCVDSIARHVSKLRPMHIISNDEGRVPQTTSDINMLLSRRPNEFMTASEFLYKLTAQMLLYGNSFVYIKKQNNYITGFYPLNFASCELKSYKNDLYLQFTFRGGKKETIPYSDIIHLRRNFTSDDILGQGADNALKEALSNLHKARMSIANKVENSGRISGILKLAGNVSAANWYDNAVAWVKRFKSYSSETAGIAALDSSTDFIPVNSPVESADDAQLQFLQNEIYSYFGVGKSIIEGNYTESEWQSFYESIIDPLQLQLSQEFTHKIFNSKQISDGNYIDFSSNRLSYASTENKIAMVKELASIGILTSNEAREIFDLPPVSDGNKRLVSLNYVNADIQDTYQLNKNKKDD